MPWIEFDFFPQTSYKDVNRPRGYKRAIFPHSVEQLVACEDAAAVSGEIFEKPELADGGENRFTLHPYSHRRDVNFQVAELNHFVARGLWLRAENVADSRNQLSRTEGFRYVSVASGVEGLEPIGFECTKRNSCL